MEWSKLLSREATITSNYNLGAKDGRPSSKNHAYLA